MSPDSIHATCERCGWESYLSYPIENCPDCGAYGLLLVDADEVESE